VIVMVLHETHTITCQTHNSPDKGSHIMTRGRETTKFMYSTELKMKQWNDIEQSFS
jgi:hypothetical protein